MPMMRGSLHRAAVDQRHAKTPAEDAEHRSFLDDAQVGEQRKLEPAGDRMPGDRRDHRLLQRHARRPHRTRRLTAGIEVVAPLRIGERGKVGAGAKTFPPRRRARRR